MPRPGEKREGLRAKIKTKPYKLGRSVQWDGEKTRIVGDDEANKLLRRDYRGQWKYPQVS